jgi:hypothetical protein
LTHGHESREEIRHIFALNWSRKIRRNLFGVFSRFETFLGLCFWIEYDVILITIKIPTTQFARQVSRAFLAKADAVAKLQK